MKQKFTRSSLIELLVFLILLSGIIWLRSYHLDADPPLNLSSSSDVFTDPPNLTLYAKQKIITDEFTPSGDDRFVLFLKSSLTVVGLFVFKSFGTSIISSNLIGLFFSIGSLLLFFLIVRKTGGRLAGIFFLLLIALNYNQIFYGRLTFQEHAMSFFGFLAITLLIYFNNRFIDTMAGVSLGLAVFFAKIIGVAFLFPFTCFFLYRYLFERTSDTNKRIIYFTAGFSLLTIFWLFYTYFPMQEQVSSYIGEHVSALYGFPEGLESLDNFIRKFLTFGINSFLFNRMKTASLFTAFFVGIVIFRLLRAKRYKADRLNLNSNMIFITALIIGFFLFLMIWNYRPLRYQLVLIYPFCGAAAIALSMMWEKRKKIAPTIVPFYNILIFLPLAAAPFYHIYQDYINIQTGSFSYNENKYLVILISIILSSIVFLIVKLYKMNKIPRSVIFNRTIIVIFICSTLYFSWSQYDYWRIRATFSARDNSRDLKMILNPNAVITGPFSSSLTLENEFKSIIHMFGVSKPNPDFFKKFPITHLLVDSGNEKRAFKDYPKMMKNSSHILTYHIGRKKVRLYRISGNTGNPKADSYQPSDFEQLINVYNNSGQLNNQLAIQFLQKNPDNITCYMFLAETAQRDSIYDLAEAMFKKAVEFSPTNYNLTARLAKFYEERFEQTKITEYKEKSLFYYDMAVWVSPVTSGLKQAREKLRIAQ